MEDYSKMSADQLVAEALAACDRIDGHIETLKRLNAEDEARLDRASDEMAALFFSADQIMAKPIYQD